MSSHTATLMRVEDERGVRCVVTQADDEIWIVHDLIAEIRSGKHFDIEGGAVLDGSLLSFGVEGEGLGRVTYRLVGLRTEGIDRIHIAERITKEDTDDR